MTATTKLPIAGKMSKVTLTLFAPRTPEEAQKQGVFVAPTGVTYCHFHAIMHSEDGTTQVGRLVAYKDLAERIGQELLKAVQAHRTEMETSRKKDKEFKGLVLVSDLELKINPEFNTEGEFLGNHVDFSVYAFRKDGMYITTRGGTLVISEDRDTRAVTTTSVISFF